MANPHSSTSSKSLSNDQNTPQSLFSIFSLLPLSPPSLSPLSPPFSAASNLCRFKHHLIGEIEPFHNDVTAAEFRHLASDVIADVISRGKVPILVGGSNSFIYALLVDEFEPHFDVFDDDVIKGEMRRLRYECCFIWVDVAFPVLTPYLSRRLEEMLDEGMFDELAEFHRQKNKEKGAMTSFSGVGKSIRVFERRRYFKEFPGTNSAEEGMGDDSDYRLRRREAYEEAVTEVKRNTWQLAKRQVGKIGKLRKAAGWELERVCATEAFKAVMLTSDDDDDVAEGGIRERWSEIWEREVVEPSVKIVGGEREEREDGEERLRGILVI